MEKNKNLQRYSVIKDKNPREIVLLRGRGCFWKKCAFCDYHLDSSGDLLANFELNKEALDLVTGEFGVLEIVNSGSIFELDQATMDLIKTICQNKKIKQLHCEAHYAYHQQIAKLKAEFKSSGINLKMKIGIETFDINFRENVLLKGLGDSSPQQISNYFEECCLLVGIKGQSIQSILNDIECALLHFERVCVNVFRMNITALRPDYELRAKFIAEIYPRYKNNPQIDILLDNTDFGVGEVLASE